MKEIFIKYNPYKLETNIKVDKKTIKPNSALNVGEKRLQEWIEDLPQILVNELNAKSFKIKFHGTELDYEDLKSVCKDTKKNDINIMCEHIPTKGIHYKELYLKQIFWKIQNGPFEELKQDDIKNAFNKALSSEFEVDVVATMSAGKSTLINALLGKKIMPAKKEACTAVITKIKDNDLESFKACTYDSEGELLGVYSDLDYDTMNKLNSNKYISTIEVEGNIPFVDSSDTSLVLVDTPGTNNCRDTEYKATIYKILSKSSKSLIIYILNATQLGVNDDNELLNYISENMKVGGKQSKDRFIFVVNKFDNFKSKYDSAEGTINKVRSYLENKGFENPNIFPAAALLALDIRTILNDIDISKINFWDDDLDSNIEEAYMELRKLNRKKELHLENYSNLPPSIKNEIDLILLKAKEENDKKTEALIHTGIVPIELAIKLYVDKYIKTAKIKNIVDTFYKNLDSAKIFESVRREILKNQNERDKILKQINNIKSKLISIEEAKKFKETIETLDYIKDIESEVDYIINEAQKRIEDLFYSINETRISLIEAREICTEISRFTESIKSKVQVELEDTINNYVQKYVKELFEVYKQKLDKEIKIENIFTDFYEILNSCTKSKSSINTDEFHSEKINIEVGWEDNRNKKWYKQWKWFDEYRNLYDTRELVQNLLSPIQLQLFDNRYRAIDYAQEQFIKLRILIQKKFSELDYVLVMKLEELERNIIDIEEKLNESKNRLEWLEDIKSHINTILEI